MTLTDQERENREQIRWDTVLFASNFVDIVNKRGVKQKLVPKPEQVRFDDALLDQDEAGLPMRAIVLKARQLGFCLAPWTRVLTADLRWVTIDSVQPGDRLVGCDELPAGGGGTARKMRVSTVEAVRYVHDVAYRVRLDNGAEFVATGQHRFLARWGARTETHWREVEKMRVGDRIRHVAKPWDAPGAEDGWMAGMLDGEGTLRPANIAVYQRPGAVADRAEAYLCDHGYEFAKYYRDRAKDHWHDAVHLTVRKRGQMLRLVGSTRPTRWTDDISWWEGRELPAKNGTWPSIVSIERLDVQPMVDLQTDHKTFVAEGLVSHNSTWTQAKLIQRVTQNPYQRALVLAQEHGTAGELFEIGRRMYEGLPDYADLRPKVVGRRKMRLLEFDNHSWYRADSAKEFESGRGLTLHSLHISELAFYPDAQRKLTGLLQAVPSEPGTLIVLESTANGQNYFKELWDAASSGESDYIPFFSAWFEEPTYRRGFANQAEREEFQATVGDGEFGDDEPALQDLGVDLEQLAWRRWVIRNQLGGDLDRFRQEFPSTPTEAFITSGRTVFKVGLIRGAERNAADATPRAVGRLEATAFNRKPDRSGQLIDVPAGVKFVEGSSIHDDRAPGWLVWEHPKPADEDTPAGQYVIAADVSGGEERNGATAYHVIEVIDHRTRVQVAEYRSRIDPDTLAQEIFLACLYYNRPWAAPEITGGWGGPVARRLKFDYKYPFVYQRPKLEGSSLKTEERLGWDTNWVTKRHMEDVLNEVLRASLTNELHVVRSKGLAQELGWYVRDNRNRSGPEAGKWSDRVMAFGIAQAVAQEKPLRPERRRGEVHSTLDNAVIQRQYATR